MRQDPLDLRPIQDERDDPHRLTAPRARERQTLEEPRQQQGPAVGGEAAGGTPRLAGVDRAGCLSLRQPHLLTRLLQQLQSRARRPGRLGDRPPEPGVGSQHPAVPVLVDPRRGHQVRQTIQQLQRGQDQLAAAVEGGLAQAVDQVLRVEAAQSLLAQRRSGAVPDQALEAVAVPVGDGHRGVHGPAAGVISRVEGVHGGAVQVAVAQ